MNAWEKRKLGNISEIRTGPFGSVLHAKDYVDDGVPIITTEHFKSGALPTCKFNLPQVSAEDFRRLKSYNLQPGDVVFSRVGSVDVSAEVLPLQDGWLFSGRVLRVRPKESVSGAFLHYVLSTTLIKRNIRSRAVGQTMPSINTKILNDTSIVLPHKTSEQNKISSALANLDSLIAATQDKLDCLERVKKALLQHLFDQSMRFKGYSDPWEKRKLGSIGKIKSGSGFPSIEQGGKQGIPFYKVSDMNTSGNKNSMVISQNYVTSAQLKKRKWTPITNTPAIIFAKVGAAIFLDRKRVVEHPFLIDNNMMAYIVGDAWNLRFCQAFFQSIPLLKFAQTGALPSLNAHDIGRIPVHLPTRYEQKEIGDLIYKVTRLIAATQSKLSSLESLKKALLQGLFI